MSVAGIYSYIEYGKQSSFTSTLSAGAATRAFGMDQKVTTLSIDEGKFELGDLYSQNVQKFAFGSFAGTLGVEWTLSNPWFFDSVLTLVTTGVGPYTHTYDDSKTVNTFGAEVGIDTTTDRVIQLQQMTAKDLNISASVGDLIKCRENFTFGKTASTAGTSLDASVVTDDITYPYTFVQATLENPSGTPLAEVQNFDLTINPNIRQVMGMNSQYSTSAYKGKLELSGKFSITVVDNTWWNNVRARTEPTNNTLKMKFTNGLTSTNERSIAITLTGLGLGNNNMSLDPNELVVEEIPFTSRDIQVVAINNTSAAP